ncbi:hypothetical protein D3C80_2091150 [compost metagenome]
MRIEGCTPEKNIFIDIEFRMVVGMDGVDLFVSHADECEGTGIDFKEIGKVF